MPDHPSGPGPDLPPTTARGWFSTLPVPLRGLIRGSLLAVLLVAGGWMVTRPLGGQPWVPLTAGEDFYQIGAQRAGLQIGDLAPELSTSSGEGGSLTDLDGRVIESADFAGRPLWIVFWASWCIPCREELPDLKAAFSAHADDDLVVLAINFEESTDVVRAFAAENGLDYIIGLDPHGAVIDRYGGWGLPTHYFVDRDGVIRGRYFGPLSRELMESQLQTILAP
ncbi:MAG: TlpA disulfide reductase family protein [Candidatus Limnocylindria bacterium]